MHVEPREFYISIACLLLVYVPRYLCFPCRMSLFQTYIFRRLLVVYIVRSRGVIIFKKAALIEPTPLMITRRKVGWRLVGRMCAFTAPIPSQLGMFWTDFDMQERSTSGEDMTCSILFAFAQYRQSALRGSTTGGTSSG